MIFREATVDDLPRLMELEQAIIDSERPYNPSIKEENVTYYDLIGLVGEVDAKLLIVEDEGRIIGSGYAQIRESRPYFKHHRHCYLGFIFVESEFRGRGIAKTILNSLIHWGKSHGLNTFNLDVYSANESAVGVYEKLGFKPLTVNMELTLEE